MSLTVSEHLPEADYASFTPTVPQPNPKHILDYTWRDHMRTLAGMATNPIKTLSTYQFELPVFQYQIFGTHFTVVNDPGMIRHCFVKNASNYTLEPIRQAILTPALRNGLVAVEGAKWKQARRVLAPIFTPKYTQYLAERMRLCVETKAEDLIGQGGRQQIADIMSSLAYDVLSDTLFSGDISADATDMMRDVSDFFQYMGNVDPFDMLQAPRWVPRPTRLRGGRAVARLRDRIAKLVERRRRLRQAGERLPDDFLTRLLEGKNEVGEPLAATDIQDHILTFIAAGHETTARGLAWTLYLLAHDGRVRNLVETEIDHLYARDIAVAEWVDHMPYTTACFEEAMRLYPPAPFITRMAKADDRYNLAFVPKGGYLFLNLYALHRHKMLWACPDDFIPERFLAGAKDRIDRFAYLPFGVGHRVCIGSQFAMQEALIILAAVLRHYRLDYASDVPPCPVMRITLKPDNGIPMQVSPR